MSPYILLLILINIGIVACFLEKPILKESNEELLLSPQFPPETYKHEHQRTPRYVVFLIHKIHDRSKDESSILSESINETKSNAVNIRTRRTNPVANTKSNSRKKCIKSCIRALKLFKTEYEISKNTRKKVKQACKKECLKNAKADKDLSVSSSSESEKVSSEENKTEESDEEDSSGSDSDDSKCSDEDSSSGDPPPKKKKRPKPLRTPSDKLYKLSIKHIANCKKSCLKAFQRIKSNYKVDKAMEKLEKKYCRNECNTAYYLYTPSGKLKRPVRDQPFEAAHSKEIQIALTGKLLD